MDELMKKMDQEFDEQMKKIQKESELRYKELTKPIYELKEKIGEEKWNEIVDEACIESDKELRELLGEEKWQIFLACSGDTNLKENIINDIGTEKFNELRNEVNEIVEKHLNNKQ